MATDITVYYVLDPMCAWCWAFRSPWQQLRERITESFDVRYVMGGIAPDTDEPMSAELIANVKGGWTQVAEQTSAEFNFDYWDNNEPRRATYPACRAALAASNQAENGLVRMVEAIQELHYLHAGNTTDTDVLAQAAIRAGLNADQLVADMNSEPIHDKLTSDFMIRDRFGVTGFPSVLVEQGANAWALSLGYCDADTLLKRWDALTVQLGH